MRLLLIGAPGAGKGTQAVRIAGHFGIAHISSGELLRQHVTHDTAIGRTIRETMRRGDLVSDDIVMEVLREPIETASRNGGYVLDGFPRTAEQAGAADLMARDVGASVQVALFLEVRREELVRRLVARGRQAGRADDTEEVINHRLQVFDEHNAPLVDYYRRDGRLITVDSGQPLDEVTASAIAQLRRVRDEVAAD